MIHPIDAGSTTIYFENAPVKLYAVKGQVHGNGWIAYGITSDDPIFMEVFHLNPFSFMIKPSRDFAPDMCPDIKDKRQLDLIQAVYRGLMDLFYKNIVSK